MATNSQRACEWVNGDPHESVRSACWATGNNPNNRNNLRDLGEVLDDIERADCLILLTQRLALKRVGRTRSLLSDLGLVDDSGRLLDAPERAERVEAMREVYL